MSVEQNSLIAKRAVFFIGGYDPKSSDAFFDRQAREIGRFESTWNVTAKETNRTQLDDDTTMVQYESDGSIHGHSWQSQTDFHFMTLDDIVLKRFADPLHKRISRYLSTFSDYVGSGTVQKFIHHAWRFSLYFFYPVIMLLCAVLISLAAALLFASVGVGLSGLIVPVAFLLMFVACVKLGANRYHVLHLMDLWSFSRDYLHGKQESMDQKLDAFAALIANAGEKQEYDEIILIGHSTGGALILDAAGRANERSPSFAEGRTKVYVLTVGSTALKIGMHPAAGWFRKRLADTFSSSSIQWIEYQCLSDVINFYKSDPAELMGFAKEMRAQPLIDNIRIKRMVADPAYSRMRWHFFRIHYQFVFGNTLKYHYDYPAIVLGPAKLVDRARHPKKFDLSMAGTTLHEEEKRVTASIAAIIWCAGIVLWTIIRFPHRKKAKKTSVVTDRRSSAETIALTACIVGLVGIPAVHLILRPFQFADYSFVPAMAWIGLLAMGTFLLMFHLSHKHLAKNWSVTLEIRKDHKLVDTGIYSKIRHPMYTSFWLWGIAQALLLPNWIAGFAGLVSVAWLYFSRIDNEEAMMRQQFGAEYDDYCSRTNRLTPKFF